MKRRKVWLSLTLLAIGFAPGLLRGQNVGININPVEPTILQGEQGYLEVKLCNTDPNGNPSPANTLRVLVSVPTNLTVIGLVKTDGTPADSDLTTLFLTNDDSEGSHNVKVQYKNVLNNFDCYTFRVVLEGKSVGAGGTILANLGFASPPLSNDAGDDNSSTSIDVAVNLPVKLKDFNVERQENNVKLAWSTSEEVNSDRFEVQRSSNGKDWAMIESIYAAGESNQNKEYSAVDKAPLAGENLYRLRMIDKDGSVAFSRIRSIHFAEIGMVLFPNPVKDFLNVKAENWAKVVMVKIINQNGIEIYRSGSRPESSIDVRTLAIGIYAVEISTVDGSSHVYRIAVVK